MATIRTLFRDVGGALLPHAWDHQERVQASERFGQDNTVFEARHEPAVERSEPGRLSLDGDLGEPVFYRPRPFTREDSRGFMFSVSASKNQVLELAQRFPARICWRHQ